MPAPAPPPIPGPVPPPPPAAPVDPIPPPRDIAAERLEGHVKASKDSDAAVRRKAALALGTFLTDPDVLFRRKASKSLFEMGAESAPAADALNKAAKDDDREVRDSARRTLIHLLALELGSKEPGKRIKALEGIAAYGPEANIVGEQLIAAMTDSDPKVRDHASETFEKVNPKVHPHVFTILRGSDKSGAVLELERLGEEAKVAVPLLLWCRHRVLPRGNGMGDVSIGNTFTTVAKIAPKDRRFAAAVLAQIVAVNPPPVGFGVGPGVFGSRAEALNQLVVIEAEPADKVKALLLALGDGNDIVRVITCLQEFRQDAKPALPALKKLKLSPDDNIRKAATEAVKMIEGE